MSQIKWMTREVKRCVGTSDYTAGQDDRAARVPNSWNKMTNSDGKSKALQSEGLPLRSLGSHFEAVQAAYVSLKAVREGAQLQLIQCGSFQRQCDDLSDALLEHLHLLSNMASQVRAQTASEIAVKAKIWLADFIPHQEEVTAFARSICSDVAEASRDEKEYLASEREKRHRHSEEFGASLEIVRRAVERLERR